MRWTLERFAFALSLPRLVSLAIRALLGLARGAALAVASRLRLARDPGAIQGSRRARNALALAAGSALAVAPWIVLAQQATPARPAAAIGPMCVASEVRQRVDACPSNAPSGAATATGEAPRSRLRTAKRHEEEKQQVKRGPSVELDTSARRNQQAVQARAWDLLQREVTTLDRMARNSCPSTPRCPDILLRQANTYFEMQQVLNARVRGYDDPIFQAGRAKNQNLVRELTQKQSAAQGELTKARESAIGAYATLVQSHPNYSRMDEVLFSLAFGLEELSQVEKARQVYFRLIKGFPTSQYVPHAWLSFAEYYFNDGDMSAANEMFRKVLEYPPDQNPVYGYAVYKMAWAAFNLEDYRGSLQRFVETIEFAQTHPDARDVENLSRSARREMVLPYAMVGQPNRALEFFRRYAVNGEQALEIFENLGELYYDTGQWPNTIAVYHQLMAERPAGDKVCYWQSRVSNAVVSSRPKDEQTREVQRMVDMWESFDRANHPDQAKQECKQAAASVLVELATAWHREAIGTSEQPGTNDRRTMNLAAELYQLVLQKFPDMGQMEFPDIDRRDWPTQCKVLYYYAELLWKMEDWARCGPAFDAVVQCDPAGEFTADAAYAAVLCYNNQYQQQYQSRERETRTARGPAKRPRGRGQPEVSPDAAARYATRDFTQLEQGMLNAFQRYVCFVPNSEELAQIKYRRARIFYESNHFEEAALLFRDIAWNHRDSELAEYAANLYLDALNVLGSMVAQPRVPCLDQMETDLEPMYSMYCEPAAAREAHQALCDVIECLRVGVLRKKAEAYQTNHEYLLAARTYVAIWQRYGSGENECAGRMDEVLHNASINYEATRLVGRAIQWRGVLIQRFPDTELGKRNLYLIGANYHALAFYEQAADYYEQFARRFPGEDGSRCTDAERTANVCVNATEALQNAVVFRLGLGDFDRATADARLFETNYKRRLPLQTSQVIFSLGAIYERQESWREVEQHYRTFLRNYERQALPQQVIRAHVQIAMSFWKRDNKRAARPEFEAAVARWNHGAAETIAGLDGLDDTQKALYLLAAKTAASEALFYLAEYKYEEFAAIQFPTFSGRSSLERVNEWSREELLPWSQRKLASLQAAAAEYERIAPLEVPEWQIAAAARIGEMYRTFVDQFRDAPVPDEVRDDPELFDAYVGALDEQSEPLARQAIDKFEFCLITATRVRWFNQWSQTCERELNTLDPRRYPLAAELRGQPNLIYATPARPAPVELGTAAEDDAPAAQGGT